jgi:hypothetical protein
LVDAYLENQVFGQQKHFDREKCFSQVQELHPVWKDEEEERIFVDLRGTSRLKKLKRNVEKLDQTLTGVQYSDLLKSRSAGFLL